MSWTKVRCNATTPACQAAPATLDSPFKNAMGCFDTYCLAAASIVAWTQAVASPMPVQPRSLASIKPVGTGHVDFRKRDEAFSPLARSVAATTAQPQ